MEREQQRERKRLLRAGKAAIREAVRTPTGATRELGIHRSYELAQRDDHGADTAPAHPENQSYNRFAREPSRKTHRYAHSGVWEHNEEIGAHVWSDTMGEVKDDGLGDKKYLVNPDAWNYTSPFKPKTEPGPKACT